MTIVSEFINRKNVRIDSKKWGPTLTRINDFAAQELTRAMEYLGDNKSIKDETDGSND
jgi:hypothetical protein